MRSKNIIKIISVVFIIIVANLNMIGCRNEYSDDYKKISKIIPEGWEIIIQGNKIDITSKDTFWFYNILNIDVKNTEELEKFAKEYGNPRRYKIVLEFEQRWTDEKLNKAKENRDIIKQNINNLPEKLKIVHLQPTKGPSYFKSETEMEKKKVRQFERERKELEEELSICKVPDFNTKRHSIFISNNKKWYELIYPYSEEPYLLERNIRNMFSNK
jgi:hypothetical protein